MLNFMLPLLLIFSAMLQNGLQVCVAHSVWANYEPSLPEK